MTILKNSFILILLIPFVSCNCSKSITSNNDSNIVENQTKIIVDSITNNFVVTNHKINDSTFINLKSIDSTFVYDMKYATTDNFLKQNVYDCAECYLRYKTIKSLIEANNEFKKLGFQIKIYDCYRPIDIQKKMWSIVSNPEYVANPSKGSIHNRGCAVDITLVDTNGKELDMGTSFDHFGIEASHNYQNISNEVKKNRLLLKDVMQKHNFNSFDSEWWHYNLVNGNLEKLANFKWKCN